MAAKELYDTILVQDPNLQFYSKFEDNGNDLSPNHYDLSPTGSPSYAAGKFNKGVVVGGGVYLSIANASCPKLDITGGSMTVGAWITANTNAASIISKYNSNGYLLYINWGADTLRAEFYIPGVNGVTSTPNHTIASGVQYFIGGRWNKATGKLSVWINTTKYEMDATGDVTHSAEPFGIGSWGGSAQHNVDDAWLFDRALTDAEITGYINGTLDPPVWTSIKKISGVTYAMTKKVSGLVIASVKKVSGLA